MLQNGLSIQHLGGGLRVPESNREHQIAEPYKKELQNKRDHRAEENADRVAKRASIGLPRVKKQRHNTPSSRAARLAVG